MYSDAVPGVLKISPQDSLQGQDSDPHSQVGK